jgi:hypothetical protein
MNTGMNIDGGWIVPDWPAPAGVSALVTTRRGAGTPYGDFNLALHVGDDSERVEANRAQLKQRLAVDGIQWLQQVHGVGVVNVSRSRPEAPEADALYSSTRGLALAVMTADCLPVLFCDREGSEIAVAHAGWRGLAGGILSYTLAQFQQPPESVFVWLGPAISQVYFEVGPELRQVFLRSPAFNGLRGTVGAFLPATRAGYYYCDLYALARLSLRAAGVCHIYGGDYCTYGDSRRFYSYRREPVCGRMATTIALQ